MNKLVVRVRGRWTLGEGSEAVVLRLSREMKSRILSEVNAIQSTSYNRYSPWMSHFEKLTALRSVIEADQLTEPQRILVDTNQLSQLNRALRGPNGLDLISDPEVAAVLDEAPSQEYAIEVSAATELLSRSAPWFESHIRECICCIVPLNAIRLRGGSKLLFSSHLVKGAIFAQIPASHERRRLDLAIDIAHELGHQIVMFYFNADPLMEYEAGTRVYSGARGVPRSPEQSFHSAAALAFMVAATRELSTVVSTVAEAEYLETKARRLGKALSLNLHSLRSLCRLTRWGQALHDEWFELTT